MVHFHGQSREIPAPGGHVTTVSNITQDSVRLALALGERRSLSTAEIQGLLGIGKYRASAARRALEAMALVRPQGEGIERRWVADFEIAPHRSGGLTAGDLSALVLGHELLGFFEGTEVREWSEDLWQRIEHLSSAAHVGRARALQARFRWLIEPQRSYAGRSEALSTVIDAVTLHHTLSLTWQGERIEGFRCHLLVMYRRGLYLVGDTTADDTLRRLALDRADDVARHREKFDPRPVDEINAELQRWFGIRTGPEPQRVRLRFSPQVAHYVRLRTWHVSQTLVELGVEGVELQMDVGGQELVRFCMEWGPHVEVLEPAWLREKVVEELRGALGMYERR